MKKYFITIKIIDECWNYKIDQQFTSIVYARSEYFAEKKFQGKHNGSEYPSFIIVSITQEDSYLFNGAII
jgi:hypothetical protein